MVTRFYYRQSNDEKEWEKHRFRLDLCLEYTRQQIIALKTVNPSIRHFNTYVLRG